MSTYKAESQNFLDTVLAKPESKNTNTTLITQNPVLIFHIYPKPRFLY